jgi:hypothetical protein
MKGSPPSSNSIHYCQGLFRDTDIDLRVGTQGGDSMHPHLLAA